MNSRTKDTPGCEVGPPAAADRRNASLVKRALLVVIIWTACQTVLAQERRVTIPGMGISVDLNARVPEGFADKIMESLLPSVEWNAEGLFFGGGPVRAYQVTYAKGGGLITVDRGMAETGPPAGWPCRFSIKIERPLSAKIRHKIMVGTDLAKWEIIRRASPTPDGEPFARTYLFHFPNAGFATWHCILQRHLGRIGMWRFDARS